MRTAAAVLSVGAISGWLLFLATSPMTIPMGLAEEVEAGRALGAAALAALSLVAVAALIATRRA